MQQLFLSMDQSSNATLDRDWAGSSLELNTVFQACVLFVQACVVFVQACVVFVQILGIKFEIII
jgi:hypothetical protein